MDQGTYERMRSQIRTKISAREEDRAVMAQLIKDIQSEFRRAANYGEACSAGIIDAKGVFIPDEFHHKGNGFEFVFLCVFTGRNSEVAFKTPIPFTIETDSGDFLITRAMDGHLVRLHPQEVSDAKVIADLAKLLDAPIDRAVRDFLSK